MKKYITLFIMIFFTSFAYAIDDNSDVINDENFEQPVILEPEEIAPELKTEQEETFKSTLRGIIEKDYDLNSTAGMLKDQLTLKYKKGPIKDTTFVLDQIYTFSEIIDKNDSDFMFKPSVINFGFKGKFRSEKESYNFLFDPSPYAHENYFSRFILDAWVETKRIPNHTLTLGTFRPCVGFEGTQSAFLIPFINRTQTARNFGNVRKTGIKIKGDYKYIDYELSGYSSDTWFREFFPGVEGDAWINFKPLANLDKEKTGQLNIGGGFQAGQRNSQDYSVSSAAIRYDYKNFWMRSEWQYANGYNGASGLSAKRAWGYNVTLGYRLTKKLELLLRYDDFDGDKTIAHNNTREYTGGINYFILGQTLRVMLNYIYCQNDSKADSHKILLGTQILL